MKVKIQNLPYGTVLVDLTGAELEALTRVFAKMVPISESYVGGDEGYVYTVRNEKIKTSFEVTLARVVPESEVETLKTANGQ